MGAINLRAQVRRWRHHAALLALACVLIVALGLHHGAAAIADAHHQPQIGAIAEMCFGVFTAVGVALVAAALTLIAVRRRPRVIVVDRCGVQPTARPAHTQARAGPALLVLLCVCRR